MTFNFARASLRPSLPSALPVKATIKRCIVGSLSTPMNMCSVRQSPTPLAPKSRARFASSGVSAFVQTINFEFSSAHSRIFLKSSVNVASTILASPAKKFPVVPSTVTQSPFLKTLSPTVKVSLSTSITASSQPQTAGLPIPRATTAACDVIPPLEVTTPFEANNP